MASNDPYPVYCVNCRRAILNHRWLEWRDEIHYTTEDTEGRGLADDEGKVLVDPA